MGKKDLSHAQIWDDSALVDSWNEALEEYKKYHSLAAKGEKVDLDALETSSDEGKLTPHSSTRKRGKGSTQSKVAVTTKADVADFEQEAPAVNAPDDALKIAGNHSSVQNSTAEDTNRTAIPEALLGTMQDGDMKNLMMSWYYAGYYTGLYEGKQQAFSAMQQDG